MNGQKWDLLPYNKKEKVLYEGGQLNVRVMIYTEGGTGDNQRSERNYLFIHGQKISF